MRAEADNCARYPCNILLKIGVPENFANFTGKYLYWSLFFASVNCFSGANTSDMKHYIKWPIKKNPNAEVVIIHTGTNNLRSDSTPTEIATNMMDLATDLKKNLN